MKQRAIIVDLDGTLCNTEHRQIHMNGPKKNWPAFYQALKDDSPHSWCLEIIAAMKAKHCKLILVSGRPDNYKSETVAWLRTFCPMFDALYMRKSLDMRKDAVVKEEIYRNQIAPYFDVLFCIDDRQQVVDMWRSLGLTCLQCAKGDF